MILSEFLEDVRLYVPHALSSVVTETQLTRLLNRAVIDVAYRTLCLPANQKFNSVANQDSYDLSSVVTRFLTIDKEGLYFLNGSVYKQLIPKTFKWLDENRPSWRNESGSTPLYYARRGALIYPVPYSTSTTTNAFWLYFGQKPSPMNASGHYPFSGSTSQISHLEPLDEAILRYCQWKLHMIIGKPDEALSAKNEFLGEIAEQVTLLSRQRDIVSAKDTRLMGPYIKNIR